MMDEEIKADHFKNIRELLETCKMWIRDEDYDALGRWFDLGALEELINYIDKQQKQIEELKNINKKLNCENQKLFGETVEQQKEIEELKKEYKITNKEEWKKQCKEYFKEIENE